MDKIKRCSDDEENQSESCHSASENENDAETVDDKGTGTEMCIQRKRSASIYEKPKWLDQVAQGIPDSAGAIVLFSDDEKHKLSRAYTVAACRFRRRGIGGSSLRMIREESRNGSEICVVIIEFITSLNLFSINHVCQLYRFWDKTKYKEKAISDSHFKQ